MTSIASCSRGGDFAAFSPPSARPSPPPFLQVGVDDFGTLPWPRPPSHSWASTDALGVLGRVLIPSPRAHSVPNVLPRGGAAGGGAAGPLLRDAQATRYGFLPPLLECELSARSSCSSQSNDPALAPSAPSAPSMPSAPTAPAPAPLPPRCCGPPPRCCGPRSAAGDDPNHAVYPPAAPPQKCGSGASTDNGSSILADRFPLPWTDRGGPSGAHAGRRTSVGRLPVLVGSGAAAGACDSPPLVSMLCRRRPLREAITLERLPLIREVDASDAGKVCPPLVLPVPDPSGCAMRARAKPAGEATDETTAAPPPKVLPPSLLPPPGLPKRLDGRQAKRAPARLRPIGD